MHRSDITRDTYMLKGFLSKKGYDWWWHSFTGINRETGEEKAFFIEYFICNPALGGDKPILGQLKENQSKGTKPSYVLIKAGAWGKDAKQIHNFYPITDFKCAKDKLDIKVKDCTLTEKHMKGKCLVTEDEAKKHPEYMCDPGSMVWDIEINKKISYNVGYGASMLFRMLNVFEMFWHAEGIATEYSGEIVFDEVIYDIIPQKSYGYADKNWGSDFTSPWLWISSCNLESLITGRKLKNSAIEIGGGRPTVFGVPINRKILVGMYYEGEMYDYNFSKFWSTVKIDFDFQEGDAFNLWKVNASNKNSILELTLKCRKDEMIFINYESPNGKKLHNRLWNGGTGFGEIKLYKKVKSEKKLIDYISIKNTGCEYGEYT